MGQYFKVLNLDKKEYLHPHCCGDGLKLMEFGGGRRIELVFTDDVISGVPVRMVKPRSQKGTGGRA